MFGAALVVATVVQTLTEIQAEQARQEKHNDP